MLGSREPTENTVTYAYVNMAHEVNSDDEDFDPLAEGVAGAVEIPVELQPLFTQVEQTPRAFDAWVALLAAAEPSVCFVVDREGDE